VAAARGWWFCATNEADSNFPADTAPKACVGDECSNERVACSSVTSTWCAADRRTATAASRNEPESTRTSCGVVNISSPLGPARRTSDPLRSPHARTHARAGKSSWRNGLCWSRTRRDGWRLLNCSLVVLQDGALPDCRTILVCGTGTRCRATWRRRHFMTSLQQTMLITGFSLSVYGEKIWPRTSVSEHACGTLSILHCRHRRRNQLPQPFTRYQRVKQPMCLYTVCVWWCCCSDWQSARLEMTIARLNVFDSCITRVYTTLSCVGFSDPINSLLQRHIVMGTTGPIRRRTCVGVVAPESIILKTIPSTQYTVQNNHSLHQPFV